MSSAICLSLGEAGFGFPVGGADAFQASRIIQSTWYFPSPRRQWPCRTASHGRFVFEFAGTDRAGKVTGSSGGPPEPRKNMVSRFSDGQFLHGTLTFIGPHENLRSKRSGRLGGHHGYTKSLRTPGIPNGGSVRRAAPRLPVRKPASEPGPKAREGTQKEHTYPDPILARTITANIAIAVSTLVTSAPPHKGSASIMAHIPDGA